MKIFWLCCLGFLLSSPTTMGNDPAIHDVGSYFSFQFIKSEQPLITPQFWLNYKKRLYVELRYNYEARKTFSMYFGTSFSLNKKYTFLFIPMIGGSYGEFNGVAPAYTCILESETFSGFSQGQYSMNLNVKKDNFFFDWTSLKVRLYKNYFTGIASQNFIPAMGEEQIYLGTVIAYKRSNLTLEGYAYNFWKRNWMLAIGTLYLF